MPAAAAPSPSVSDVVAAIADVLALVMPGTEPATVHPDQRFREDLGVGSLAMVELVIGLERRFSLSLPDAELRGIRTVRELAEQVAGQPPA